MAGRAGVPVEELGEEPASIAVEDLRDDDVYGIQFDAGTYQLALVDANGCAVCGSAREDADGGLECETITVAPGEVSRNDILIDGSGQ